jgi:hypothetical protein
VVKRRLFQSGWRKHRKQNILLTPNQGELRRGRLVRATLPRKIPALRIPIRKSAERRRRRTEKPARTTQVAVRLLLSLTIVPVPTHKLSAGLVIRKDILRDLRGAPSMMNGLVRTQKKPRQLRNLGACRSKLMRLPQRSAPEEYLLRNREKGRPNLERRRFWP